MIKITIRLHLNKTPIVGIKFILYFNDPSQTWLQLLALPFSYVLINFLVFIWKGHPAQFGTKIKRSKFNFSLFLKTMNCWLIWIENWLWMTYLVFSGLDCMHYLFCIFDVFAWNTVKLFVELLVHWALFKIMAGDVKLTCKSSILYNI